MIIMVHGQHFLCIKISRHSDTTVIQYFVVCYIQIDRFFARLLINAEWRANERLYIFTLRIVPCLFLRGRGIL